MFKLLKKSVSYTETNAHFHIKLTVHANKRCDMTVTRISDNKIVVQDTNAHLIAAMETLSEYSRDIQMLLCGNLD